MLVRAPLSVPCRPWFRGIPGPVAATVAVLVLMLTPACGFGGYSSPALPGPEITRFTAAKPVITQGDSTSLTAVFSTGAGSVDQGVGAVESGTPAPVQPEATTPYALTVTGANGGRSTLQVTVQVVPPPDPTITAVPATATAGQTFSASVPLQDVCSYAWTSDQHGILNGLRQRQRHRLG